MGEPEKEGPLKRLLKHIPGKRAPEEDKGNSYEFEATIGKKGSSLGFTFDTVSQVLGRIQEGMKARVTMVREPGRSLFTARIHFIARKEEKEAVS